MWLPAVDAHRMVEGMEALSHQRAVGRDHVVATTVEAVGAQILLIRIFFHKIIFLIIKPDTNLDLILRDGVSVREVVNLPLNLGIGRRSAAGTFGDFFAELAKRKL